MPTPPGWPTGVTSEQNIQIALLYRMRIISYGLERPGKTGKNREKPQKDKTSQNRLENYNDIETKSLRHAGNHQKTFKIR